jgi:hypothetical protein
VNQRYRGEIYLKTQEPERDFSGLALLLARALRQMSPARVLDGLVPSLLLVTVITILITFG